MDNDLMIPGVAMTRRELLAASMKRLRLQRGWRLQQVAERADLNVSQISRAENGKRRPLSAYTQSGIFGVSIPEVLAPCPNCGYRPYPGFMCLTCGQGSRNETLHQGWAEAHPEIPRFGADPAEVQA